MPQTRAGSKQDTNTGVVSGPVSDTSKAGQLAEEPKQTMSSSDFENSVLAATLQRIEGKIDEKTNSLEAKVDKAIDSISSLRSEINTIHSSLSATSKTADEALELAREAKDDMRQVDTTMIKMQLNVAKLEQENKLLKDKIIRNEAQSRRDNLIFEGVQEREQEDPLNVIYNILTNMGITSARENIKIVRCHRLAGPKRQNKPRSLIVKLHYFPDKALILKKRDSLDGTGMSIRQDFPQEIAVKRKTLGLICKAANKQGKTSYLSSDRLFIDQKSYTVDTIHTLPPDLQPKHLTTPHTDEHTAFYTAHSPLSNFYSCKFKDEEGNTYSSNEQFFQYQKAIFCGDRVAAMAIMDTDNPAQCKALGDKLHVFDQKSWDEQSTEIMFNGCYAKFIQNVELKDFLLRTKDTTLIEASPRDKIWGVGVGLQNPNLFEPDHWCGQNRLGKVLEKVRGRLLRIS